MYKSLNLFIFIPILVLTIPHANAQRVCGQYTGQARTDCLNQELARGKQENDRIDRKNQRIDQATSVVCSGQKLGRKVAGRVAGAPGRVVAEVATRGGNAALGADCSPSR